MFQFVRLILLLLSVCPIETKAQTHYLVAGTYTKSNSEGIYVYDWNAKEGVAVKRSSLYTSNPSFLAVHPSQQFLYSVNENNNGQVSAFSFDAKKGTLTFINAVSSNGASPCYISIHPSGKWVVTGNYGSGGLTLFTVQPNGSLSDPVQTVQHSGSSLNKTRQSSPHVHATVFAADGRSLFVPDLGIDQVVVYPFDTTTGKISEAEKQIITLEPGSGPRHLALHSGGRYLYVLEELSGKVSVFQNTDTNWKTAQRISSLPVNFKGSIGAADIHISADGKFLYCSNRGDAHLLTVFKIHSSNGHIEPVQFISCGGTKPRNFGIDPSGNWLLAANQESNDLIIFKRNRKNGLLTPTGRKLNIPMPVFTGWIQKD
jgi:6-phosphogluconolactonase